MALHEAARFHLGVTPVTSPARGGVTAARRSSRPSFRPPRSPPDVPSRFACLAPLAALRAAVTGAAALTARWPTAAAARTIPHREERRKVVILGTGFGGSVTALRLAEAGVAG